MALIEIKNVTKVYDMGAEKVHALNGVDLEIQGGEYVAIMGSSGSGKSTLMNLIGCLDTPSSGVYRLNDVEVQGLADAARLLRAVEDGDRARFHGAAACGTSAG